MQVTTASAEVTIARMDVTVALTDVTTGEVVFTKRGSFSSSAIAEVKGEKDAVGSREGNLIYKMGDRTDESPLCLIDSSAAQRPQSATANNLG